MKRLICLLVGAWLLCAAPVLSQATPPTSGGSNPGDTVRAVSEAVQAIGALPVILLLVVLILAGIVVFFVVAALRLGNPLVSTVQKLIASRDDLQRENTEKEREAASFRARTAEAQERMVVILAEVETRTEAKNSRSEAVSTINQHVDTSVKPIKEAADKTLTTLSEVELRLNELATKSDLQEEIKPLRASIEQLREAIEKQLLKPLALEVPPVEDTPRSTPLAPDTLN